MVSDQPLSVERLVKLLDDEGATKLSREIVRETLVAIQSDYTERGIELGAEGTIMHLPYSELEQEIYRLAVDIAGPRGLVRQGGPAIGWHLLWLKSLSATIAGGTSEIQRNTIGERLLGLPRSR